MDRVAEYQSGGSPYSPPRRRTPGSAQNVPRQRHNATPSWKKTPGGNMRNRIVSLVVSLALVLVLVPQAYAMPEHMTYIQVYYSCICGPNCYGTLVGEW